MKPANSSLPNCSFNEDFCTRLEYRLCSVFENLNAPEVAGFWCNGVSPLPANDNELAVWSVNDTREINTRAWIGKDGQEEYQLAIHFGKQALRQYAKEADLSDCIPEAETTDWIDIDIKNQQIDVRLR